MFTILDYVFLIAVLYSAAVAYHKGFIQSLLGFLIWVGAVFVTKYLYPFVEPFYAKFFGKTTFFSNLFSYITVFIIFVMLFSFINKVIAKKIEDTNFNSADKTFGFLFGFFRGIIVMSLFYIIVIWFVPSRNKRPSWVDDAKCKPILKLTTMFIQPFIPKTDSFNELKGIITDDLDDNDVATFEKLQSPLVDKNILKTDSAEMGYTNSENRDLERQLLQLQGIVEEDDKKEEEIKDEKKEKNETKKDKGKTINIQINEEEIDTIKTLLKNNL